MNANETIRAILFTLTSSGEVKGRSTENALSALASRDVVQAFETASYEFREAVLNNDAESVAIVEAAHRVRVAVALRWSRAGRSWAEERLANAVDNVLDQHRDALLMVEEDPGDWLMSLGLSGDTWWSYQGSEECSAVSAVDDALELAALSIRAPQAIRDRHETAWDAHWMVNFHSEERKPWTTYEILRPGDLGSEDYRIHWPNHRRAQDNLTYWAHDVFSWVDGLPQDPRPAPGSLGLAPVPAPQVPLSKGAPPEKAGARPSSRQG